MLLQWELFVLAAHQRQALSTPELEVGGRSAAGADVAPNCRSRHAETIPLRRFQSIAIGVTARLNQLPNQSPFSPHSSLLNQSGSDVFGFVLCLWHALLSKLTHSCAAKKNGARWLFSARNLVIVFHFQMSGRQWRLCRLWKQSPPFLSELETELITLSCADLGAFWETIDWVGGSF